MPLFRPEALGAQDRLYGDVQLAPPVPLQIVGCFLFAAVVAAAIFLSLASHRQIAVVTGRIAGRGVGHQAPAAPIRRVAPTDSVPLSALLDIPADLAGRVAPGEAVRIAVDAFPDQIFGTVDARLVSLSSTTVPIRGSDGGRRDVFVATASLARNTIPAFGHAQPLRPGMTVSARIETGRRSLLAWLFDPLRSAPQR